MSEAHSLYLEKIYALFTNSVPNTNAMFVLRISRKAAETKQGYLRKLVRNDVGDYIVRRVEPNLERSRGYVLRLTQIKVGYDWRMQ